MKRDGILVAVSSPSWGTQWQQVTSWSPTAARGRWAGWQWTGAPSSGGRGAGRWSLAGAWPACRTTWDGQRTEEMIQTNAVGRDVRDTGDDERKYRMTAEQMVNMVILVTLVGQLTSRPHWIETEWIRSGEDSWTNKRLKRTREQFKTVCTGLLGNK